MNFSPALSAKIEILKKRRPAVALGSLSLTSPLLLAPMSGICNAPFRLLMEELGAGATVSELVSCHGINHGNQRTREMLFIDPRENNVGLQLFGECSKAMAQAARVAQDNGPKFIDINMGCPVRKVVTKGGGSALLKDTKILANFFSTIKKNINLPLSIKIRTGWDLDARNAQEVIGLASEEGIEFVAIHGRTRTQAYSGLADWDYLEGLTLHSPLPLIGNGDLHSPYLARQRMANTRCQALMLGRGPLRNPFIFLESFIAADEEISFGPSDYWEVAQRLLDLLRSHIDKERVLTVQLRKHIVWMAAGFERAASFRNELFQAPDLDETLRMTENYFSALGVAKKKIDHTKVFMSSGHG